MYTQVVYCLDRVPAVVKAKPELAKVEPFKTVLSGNREAMAKLSMQDLEKILAATLTGMTVDEFQADVKKWLATARDPRWQRPYTELTYQPMQEVLRYLARQRLQDLHRHRRWPGLRATSTRRRFTASRPSRWWAPPASPRYGVRQGRQAVPDQGTQAAAQRRLRRQARGHPSDDRPSAARRLRQFHRRPPDAGVHRRG